MRKGISPVIATVIIVAVAIAISIAVAGWLMGLWGGFGQTEAIKVFPDSYVNQTKLVLHIQNTGGSPAEIYKIEISGQEVPLNNPIVLQPGNETTLKLDLPNGFKPAKGVPYTVTIYTKAGNVYTSTVYGK